jgi:hypothetical protein
MKSSTNSISVFANNGIQSVAHSFDYDVDVPEPNQWFIFVDSKLFDDGNDLIRNLAFDLDSEAPIDPQNPYLFYRAKERRVEVWAMKWSDLISQNKTKLSYLGNALKAKDRNVRDVFEAEFAEVGLQKLDTVLESESKDSKYTKKKKSAKKG